jgi:hypothetical protein
MNNYLNLDEEIFNTLKNMIHSKDFKDRKLFEGIVRNNLNNDDPQTAYWSAELVCELYKDTTYEPLLKLGALEKKRKWIEHDYRKRIIKVK